MRILTEWSCRNSCTKALEEIWHIERINTGLTPQTGEIWAAWRLAATQCHYLTLTEDLHHDFPLYLLQRSRNFRGWWNASIFIQITGTMVEKKPQQLVRRWTSRPASLSISLQGSMQHVQQPKEAAQVGKRGLCPGSELGGPQLFNSLGRLKNQKAAKRKRSFWSFFGNRWCRKKELSRLQQASSSPKISISVTISVFIKKCQVHAGSVGRVVGATWSYRADTWNEKVS